MEAPIILTTSSSEEEGGGECGGALKWRSKLEEYRILSDLTGFENLKAMFEAEAYTRRKKRKRKKRKTDSCQHKEDHQDTEREQLSKDEALERVEVSKPDSVLISQIEEPQNLFIGAEKEKEDSGSVEVIEVSNRKGADDGVNSAEVINLCVSSSQADQQISGVSISRGFEVAVPEGAVARKKKKRRRRKRANHKFDGAKEDDVKDNIVLRMLLRRPRYFDFPECVWETCSDCGKENHTASSYTMQKRKKPCFLCGSPKHIWKYCTMVL